MKKLVWCLFIIAFSIGCNGTSTPEDGVDEETPGDPVEDRDVSPDIPVDVPSDDVSGDDVIPDTPVEDVEEEEGIVEEHGECTSSADCEGRDCIRVPDEPGGYWLCADPAWEEATECTSPSMDECCDSSECTDGEDGGCFFTEDRTCGGPVRPAHNECFYTQCHTDEDCDMFPDLDEICVPAGVLSFPRNSCAIGYCHTQSDCSSREGGYCKPFRNVCCPMLVSGFYCVDPSVCEGSTDCGGMLQCVGGTDGWASCQEVFCPL